MYAEFFGLKSAPFSIAPDPRFLFMSERHREALAHLLYGLDGGGGFVLLSGEIGAGKTTVCRCFLEQIPSHCDVAYIFNPKLTVTELLQSVCEEFGIAVMPRDPLAPSVKDYVDPLNRFLLDAHAAGRHSVLIIDEAQNLSADVLEQLRLLTNLETHERKLLQIILIGQPELRDLLTQPSLEQLAQRVIARFHLDALSAAETLQYIEHRLSVAGWSGPLPFDAKALRLIHATSRGVPRRINLLCDRAMLGAYAQGLRRVGAPVVEAAAAEVFDRRSVPGAWRRMSRGLAWPVAGAAVGLLTMVVWTQLTSVRPAPTPWAAPATSASKPELASAAEAHASAVLPAAPEASTPSLSPVGEVAASPAGPAGANDVLPLITGPGSLTLVADEAVAWRQLAGLWRATPVDGPPCTGLAAQGIGCWRGKGNLALISQLDRPVLLWLEQGSASGWALLTSLDSVAVQIESHGMPQAMPLAQLATLWRGDMATLWRMPEGYRGLLLAGSRGPAVDSLVAMLAKVRQEVAPAGPALVNAAVMDRVSAFQVSEGLTPDGVAGPTTFMLLQRRIGVDEPRLGKRS
jgi:general secretion pathway protein A